MVPFLGMRSDDLIQAADFPCSIWLHNAEPCMLIEPEILISEFASKERGDGWITWVFEAVDLPYLEAFEWCPATAVFIIGGDLFGCRSLVIKGQEGGDIAQHVECCAGMDWDPDKAIK